MQDQYSRTQLLLGAEAMEKLHHARVAFASSIVQGQRAIRISCHGSCWRCIQQQASHSVVALLCSEVQGQPARVVCCRGRRSLAGCAARSCCFLQQALHHSCIAHAACRVDGQTA